MAAGGVPGAIGEKVVRTACISHCGGTCLLRVHVRDGVITRIETDDGEEPQFRACLMHRAFRQILYHPDRLKYPLRRVGKRGEGKFERISWDTALDTVAGEIKRVRDTYGAGAILALISGLAWKIVELTVLVNLGMFFLLALICHGQLARRRPSVGGLTEFYFFLSLGGVLGGFFNAVMAPLIFNGVYEYPLAAVLAVLGYSVNESVVVFDRIRENFRKMRKTEVAVIIDNAMTPTMSRTIITHGCTQMMVTSMLFFGGETLHYFALALTIGILFSIYSSVLVASPLLIMFGVSREDFIKPEKVEAEEVLP